MGTKLGGIEFGGTKTICVVGERGNVTAEQRFPTGEDPLAALDRCAAFFAEHRGLAAVGVGAFGPCDPDPRSRTYGHVTTTPKPGWRNVDILGGLRVRLAESGLSDVAFGFDTDVNVAALGESAFGAGRGVSGLIYVTIGTGIGGGAIVEGKLLHGLIHPEMGHMRIARSDAEQRVFSGVCPYHADCLEGVASGPALAARWGSPAESITPDDPRYEAMWDLEADHVAGALHNLVCVLSPERIIVGGGVGGQELLLSRVRPRLQASLAGYVASPLLERDIDSYIVAPALGTRSGAIGALELAARIS